MGRRSHTTSSRSWRRQSSSRSHSPRTSGSRDSGMATQATNDDPIAASALGWSPVVIGCVNWTVGAALGGLAGVFIVPIAGLSPVALTLVILPGFAAALASGFRSFSLALLFGLLLGVGQALLVRYGTDIFSNVPGLDAVGWSDAPSVPAHRRRAGVAGIRDPDALASSARSSPGSACRAGSDRATSSRSWPWPDSSRSVRPIWSQPSSRPSSRRSSACRSCS